MGSGLFVGGLGQRQKPPWLSSGTEMNAQECLCVWGGGWGVGGCPMAASIRVQGAHAAVGSGVCVAGIEEGQALNCFFSAPTEMYFSGS